MAKMEEVVYSMRADIGRDMLNGKIASEKALQKVLEEYCMLGEVKLKDYT